MVTPRMPNDSRIMLQSGRLFDLCSPEDSGIEIGDIAHGLAHTCRYAGQCNAFFSVAEHSVLVSHVVPHSNLAALLHDAAEAFVGDMSRPLKCLLPEYKAIEERIERAILRRFNVSWPLPAEVKVADLSVMAAEQLVLMPPGTNDWLQYESIKPARVDIRRLPPEQAKQLFLSRYQELTFCH